VGPGATLHYDAGYVSADPVFTHAHVTALGPFLSHVDDAAAARIADIVATVEPFEFVLDRIDTFPNGIIHLVPEPDGWFRELTRLLAEAFPECPPYAGRFPAVVPHLTLDAQSATVTEESTAAALEATLPVSSRAQRLDLAWYQPGNCHVIRSWPLGSAAKDAAARGTLASWSPSAGRAPTSNASSTRS